ncbi:MAG: hypothetical protein CMH60_00550 [Myxococcales bacterium]|nr:hypothetical protein [Myxococcales bacterium]
MFELLLAFGVFAGLVGLVLAGQYWDALTLLKSGWALMGFGLLLGVPTGVIYHIKLFRLLAEKQAPTKGWWLDPRPLHQYLTAEEVRRCVPWFYAGGAGFGFCVLGCLCLLVALASGWFF